MQALRHVLAPLFREGSGEAGMEQFENMHIITPAPFPITTKRDGEIETHVDGEDFADEFMRIPLVETNLPLVFFKKRGETLDPGEVTDVFSFIEENITPHVVHGGINVPSDLDASAIMEEFVSTLAVEYVVCEDVPTPLPDSMWALLEEIRKRPEDDYTCTICQERLVESVAEDEQVLVCLPCDHVFHHACLETHLNSKRTCPLCRDNVYMTLANAPTPPVRNNEEYENDTVLSETPTSSLSTTPRSSTSDADENDNSHLTHAGFLGGFFFGRGNGEGGDGSNLTPISFSSFLSPSPSPASSPRASAATATLPEASGSVALESVESDGSEGSEGSEGIGAVAESRQEGGDTQSVSSGTSSLDAEVTSILRELEESFL